MNYQQFLETKIVAVQETGFEVDRASLNPMLFDWQKDIVQWALRKGRAALFEDCGMGKTPQQLEWSHHVGEHESRPHYKEDEINCFDKDVRLWLDDGAVLLVHYGKPEGAIWSITIEKQGDQLFRFTPCFDEDSDEYSDIFESADARVVKHPLVNLLLAPLLTSSNCATRWSG